VAPSATKAVQPSPAALPMDVEWLGCWPDLHRVVAGRMNRTKAGESIHREDASCNDRQPHGHADDRPRSPARKSSSGPPNVSAPSKTPRSPSRTISGAGLRSPTQSRRRTDGARRLTTLSRTKVCKIQKPQPATSSRSARAASSVHSRLGEPLRSDEIITLKRSRNVQMSMS
jgi:hypothetical protein